MYGLLSLLGVAAILAAQGALVGYWIVNARIERHLKRERRETWVALGRPHLFDLGMTQGSHFGLIRYLNSLGPDAGGDLELRSLTDRWIRWRRRMVIFWLFGPFLMLLDLYFFGSQRL